MDLLKQDIVYKEEAYKIIGAAMTVHRELGPGFLEAVYQDALEIEFKIKSIPNIREKQLKIKYKEHILNKYYMADFVCYDKIIVELKAEKELTKIDEAQAFNYLKATGYKLALLINFGESSLRYKRIVITK